MRLSCGCNGILTPNSFSYCILLLEICCGHHKDSNWCQKRLQWNVAFCILFHRLGHGRDKKALFLYHNNYSKHCSKLCSKLMAKLLRLDSMFDMWITRAEYNVSLTMCVFYVIMGHATHVCLDNRVSQDHIHTLKQNKPMCVIHFSECSLCKLRVENASDSAEK